MNLLQRVEERAEDLDHLFKSVDQLICVYLFGSQLSRPSDLSDIDFGLLFDRLTSRTELFMRQLESIDKISAILSTDKVDRVILNHAPPLLSYNIIKGVVIYCRNEEERVKFETRVIDTYLDLEKIYSEYKNALFEAIRSWGAKDDD
ncbi:MAG: nucleotidyltransferase domain-containing protein [Candidatus Heimdallarchaeota archaeon]